MRKIVIGGARSGIGKTALACRLLPHLPGWGALKLSTVRGGEAHGLAGDYEIRIARTILERPGSDTARLLAVGASSVAWAVSRAEAVPEAVARGLEALAGVPGALVEGNAAVPALPDATVVCVVPAGDADLKASAAAVLARADVVVVSGAAEDLEEGATAWRARLGHDRVRSLALDRGAQGVDDWLLRFASRCAGAEP